MGCHAALAHVHALPFALTRDLAAACSAGGRGDPGWVRHAGGFGRGPRCFPGVAVRRLPGLPRLFVFLHGSAFFGQGGTGVLLCPRGALA